MKNEVFAEIFLRKLASSFPLCFISEQGMGYQQGHTVPTALEESLDQGKEAVHPLVYGQQF